MTDEEPPCRYTAEPHPEVANMTLRTAIRRLAVATVLVAIAIAVTIIVLLIN